LTYEWKGDEKGGQELSCGEPNPRVKRRQTGEESLGVMCKKEMEREESSKR